MKKRIREIRKRQDLSQADFGRKLGVSRGVIANLELGVTNASDILIEHICQIFHINRHWLETGEGEPYIQEISPMDLVGQIATEHGYGPGGVMLLRAALRIFDELGPEALERVIAETIPSIIRDMNMDPTAAAAERAEPLGSLDINDNSI